MFKGLPNPCFRVSNVHKYSTFQCTFFSSESSNNSSTSASSTAIIFYGMSNAQARFWLLTINDDDNGNSWTPPTTLTDGIAWIRGQKEIGSITGRGHWQVFVAWKRAVRLAAVRKCFGARVHAEPSRSEAAEAYVFKV